MTLTERILDGLRYHSEIFTPVGETWQAIRNEGLDLDRMLRRNGLRVEYRSYGVHRWTLQRSG